MRGDGQNEGMKFTRIIVGFLGSFSKPSRAGEVRADGFGKHGTRTQCTASTAGAKFAHAAG
jgi:hypothetical protein